MTDFHTFWEIARHWRHPYPNPPKPAAIAYARAVKEGADPESIVSGAKGYTAAMEGLETEPGFYNSAAKFLSEWRWLQYADFEETQSREAQDRAAGLAEMEAKRKRQDAVQYEHWRKKYVERFGKDPDPDTPGEKEYQDCQRPKLRAVQ